MAGLKPAVSQLRTDTIGTIPVTVFEIRKTSESTVTPGTGRLRYWVDAHGRLRRLEVRMTSGAYGYVTITPGPVPTLPPAPKASR